MILSGIQVREKIITEIKDIIAKKNYSKKLVTIRVGNDYGSEQYEKGVINTSEKVGIDTKNLHYETISEEKLLSIIDKLNNDANVGGILLFSPLPKELNIDKLREAITVDKDVEAINTTSLGKIISNEATKFPCTPLAVIKTLEHYDIDIVSKNITIAGRSVAVGKTLGVMLTNYGSTVTVCHSKTKDIKNHIKNSDIFISAVGKAKLYDNSYFHNNHIIIDVGINRENDKTVGDIDYENVKEHVKSITPVPKGIGSVTTVLLFYNLVVG